MYSLPDYFINRFLAAEERHVHARQFAQSTPVMAVYSDRAAQSGGELLRIETMRGYVGLVPDAE